MKYFYNKIDEELLETRNTKMTAQDKKYYVNFKEVSEIQYNKIKTNMNR